MTRDSRIRSASLGLQPPRAPAEYRSFLVHGHEHHDEFAYLRDPDDSRTSSYIEAETAYLRGCLAAVEDGRERLYMELKARIIEADVSVPEAIDGYLYYTRTEAGRQYPVHYRIPDSGGEEQVYLDENRLAASNRYCEVSVVAICPRQAKFACAVDRIGDEQYEILVGSMEGGELARIARRAGDSLSWARNGSCLLYTSTDDNARPDAVWLHDLESGSHQCLFREKDGAFHVSVFSSRSGQWIFIDSTGNTSSETRAVPARSPAENPVVIFPRREDVEYTVEHHRDRFLILTNDEGENFRLISMSLPNGERRLTELIPPDVDVSLEFVDPYRDYLVVGERVDGVQRTWIWDLAADEKHYLPGAGPTAYHDVDDLYDYASPFVRYEYSTPIKPHSVFDYDVGMRLPTLRKTIIPPGYSEDEYECRRLQAPAGDVDVPLTLLGRHEALARQDGSSPLLLTGYGAYEETMDMDFDSDLVSLLDRGVIVAMAHVRGGGDLGPAWHDAGRLENKEHSFDDYLACARYLIESRYTGAGRIAAWGGSAGGLLVAVTVQRHPELFASAILEVPFLDVLNTLLDSDLPLTEYDFDEFGDPAVEEEYHWIRAYSPYDNIRPQAYPPMLVTAAMNDQRVGYWEALKWVARLRKFKMDDNPLLLKMDSTGHLGETGRYGAVKDIAILYAFLLDAWGLAP